MKSLLIMQTASVLLAITAAGGIAMAALRLSGKPQPPAALAMLLLATWNASRA